MSSDGQQTSNSDGSVGNKKGTVSPYSITAPGAGPSPPNQGENRVPVFPSQQSPSDIFLQEGPNQTNRQFTPVSANISVTFRPGFGGADGVTSDGSAKQTIHFDNSS